MNIDTTNKKVLILTIGGSHSYGLNTRDSDMDYRGVFVHTNAEHLVGLRKSEVFVSQEEDDIVLTEFRHALQLLRGANTQMIELLFISDAKRILQLDPIWALMRRYRSHLIDGQKLFVSLNGYIQSEWNLAMGIRTGRLGSKRQEAIKKYGFSPKNVVQMLRLAWAGTTYFGTGIFPVNVREFSPSFADELLSIKTHPEKFTINELHEKVDHWKQQLAMEFPKSPSAKNKFDEQIATSLCVSVYKPLIGQL